MVLKRKIYEQLPSWKNIKITLMNYVIKIKKIKLYAFLCVLLGCLISCSFALAESFDSDVVVSMQINNPVMEINGRECEIDFGQSTTPVINGGRTLVPIRAIIEAFGGSVHWDETTQSVTLKMEDDYIVLKINSPTAYLNGSEYALDVSPQIINSRTMLPIRFIAEGFNLGVAWDGNEQKVFIIRNSFDDEEYAELMREVPSYSGIAYATINNNIPYFEEYEIIRASFEYYSSLDSLGRCDVSMASVAEDIMPKGERESISSITPTGWKNKKYDVVDGGYIYNRCHLIGYQLTGENANERNLITGTRYLNISGMLPFENMVDDYIEATKNHVMYRVTPVFTGSNLVADGVLMEAYSVEDNGLGISFCVYCYNVQPHIFIDYASGENYLSETPTLQKNTDMPKIYKTPTGKRYHSNSGCGGANSYEITYDEAVNSGLTPCGKCVE